MWLINFMTQGCVDFWSAESAAEASVALQMNVIGAFMAFGAVFIIWMAIVVFVSKPPAIVHKVAAGFAGFALLLGVLPALLPVILMAGAGYWGWRGYRAYQQNNPPPRPVRANRRRP